MDASIGVPTPVVRHRNGFSFHEKAELAYCCTARIYGMKTILKLLGSVLVGVVTFVVVGGGVTAMLAPYIWLSAMLGIPIGLAAGVAAIALTYMGLTYREEVVASGAASERTISRLKATGAGTVAFVVAGGLTLTALWSQAIGLAAAILTGALPVGILTAVIVVYLVLRRSRPQVPPDGPTAQ